MRTIYKPEGRALEYSPLALNLYKGCAHDCAYCYAKRMAHTYNPKFNFSVPVQRPGLLEALEKQAAKMRGDRREINLCFMCDPYSPPTDGDITREALLILEKYKLNVTVLTKAGTAACRDFDILARNHWKFGSTITCFGEPRKKIEPGAAKMFDRVDAIVTAKKAGIFTWVSIEPVIDADQSLEIIQWGKSASIDLFKIGKANYMPEIERGIDWKKFVSDARSALGDLPYMFKMDTLKAAGEA